MSHDIRTIVQPNIASRQLDFLIDTVDVRDEDIIADKLRLTQVLLNILSNGIKFNKIGGIIGIRVKQLKSAPTGYGSYQFIIRDTGIGMKPEFQEHIFESFSREETSTVSGIQGTGLGMAITKTILEDAGFVIETANNGKTAVEIMEKAAPGQYDLILMDMIYKVIRYEIGKQCDDDVLDPHSFQCDEKGGICEASHGNYCVIQGHDIDHHPCCNSCKKY